MSQLLYPEKIARWALNRKLFGPQIRHKLPFEKLEIATPIRFRAQTAYLVTYSLYRLHYPGSRDKIENYKIIITIKIKK